MGPTAAILALTPLLPAQEAGGPDSLREAVDGALPAVLAREHVPGVAVAVLAGGAPAWAAGYGVAEVGSEQAVGPETLFSVGSISKPVAAWGVMALVEAGELELDDPVLPLLERWELPGSELATDGVTLRRLLSHTAGLSLHGYPGFPLDRELPTLEESLSGRTNWAGKVVLRHEPGTRWQYSGGGYTLAQLLLEEATGEAFAPWMAGHVLAPLGMGASTFVFDEVPAERRATPHGRDGAPIGQRRFTAKAAAGLWTSAEDLARFAAATLGMGEPAVLAPETLAAMRAPAPAAPEYGLGYQLRAEGERTLVGHGGVNLGWVARFWVAPETGDGLVVLTNGVRGGAVIDEVEALWLAHIEP